MRLRQLGSTQSITFIAPPEVQQSISDVWKEKCGETVVPSKIDSSHVVIWLLEQTCLAKEHLQNMYVAQGMDFCRRTSAQWKYQDFLGGSNNRKGFLEFIQQPESQSLEKLYGGMKNKLAIDVESVIELKGYMQELRKQRREATSSGNIDCSLIEELEQEREVEFQVEEVRHVQKQTRYEALKFPGLHMAVVHFAETGNLAERYK
jgi:hypothetical protein